MITADDLLLMSRDDCRLELLDGELVEHPFNNEEHGDCSGAIAATIWLHVRERQLGAVYAAGTGFFISSNPDVVLAPDVSFVRAGRIPEDRDRRRFIEVAPDLVVEVISPSEHSGDVTNKVQRYLNAGVQLVWVVYPQQRSVAVYRADRTWDSLQGDASLDGADVLPGFTLPLADLFTTES
jgi:Uma2 family endonuclease